MVRKAWNRNRKLAAHIFIYLQDAETGREQEVSPGYTPQKLSPVMDFFQPGSTSYRFHNLPKSSISWGPSVHEHKGAGCISHLNNRRHKHSNHRDVAQHILSQLREMLWCAAWISVKTQRHSFFSD